MDFGKQENLYKRCKDLTTRMKVQYEKIGKVFCPALKEDVIFNAKGFHHLLYKANGESRNVIEKIYKLTLLPLAKAVVLSSKNVSETRSVVVRKKGDSRLCLGKAYSLVTKVGKKRPIIIRVILLRIGNGQLAFRSIMKN